MESKHTVIVVVMVGVVLTGCLAAIAYFAPNASPIAMLALIGVIMTAILALSLGREFFLRFDFDKARGARGEMGSARQANEPEEITPQP